MPNQAILDKQVTQLDGVLKGKTKQNYEYKLWVAS